MLLLRAVRAVRHKRSHEMSRGVAVEQEYQHTLYQETLLGAL